MNGSQRQQLEAIAREAMRAQGFEPDFTAAARSAGGLGAGARGRRDAADLRDLPWSSIDNDDSRDLDQIEVCVNESGGDAVLVAIADVDVARRQGLAARRARARNTTSVYTPAVIFPMLPPELSTDRTSLNQDQDRARDRRST